MVTLLGYAQKNRLSKQRGTRGFFCLFLFNSVFLLSLLSLLSFVMLF